MDPPGGVASASGSYGAGVFTIGTGGLGFNAGTVDGDLDILGNTLSVGTLSNNQNSAGLSLTYSDSATQQAAETQAAILRPAASWIWARAAGAATPAPQMQLDGANRLTLYDPAHGGQAAVVISPGAPWIITPQGDLP